MGMLAANRFAWQLEIGYGDGGISARGEQALGRRFSAGLAVAPRAEEDEDEKEEKEEEKEEGDEELDEEGPIEDVPVVEEDEWDEDDFDDDFDDDFEEEFEDDDDSDDEDDDDVEEENGDFKGGDV
jgi:hypothetical protein